MSICDLHTHSVFSDGTFYPEEILKQADEIGLAAVALTDHNTVAGLSEFIEKSKKYKVEGVAGVEISSEYNGVELHVLGLYLQPDKFDKVGAFVSEFIRRKEQSNILLAKNLQQAGYAIDYNIIKSKANGNINRMCFACELLEKGYVDCVKTAFETFLSESAGFYVPPKRIPTLEVIKFIKSIGAVAVLAHPLLNLDLNGLTDFLPKAKAVGLDAIETDYATYNDGLRATSRRLADKYGLKRSGGSDFHGDNKPQIALGVGAGDLAVPYEYALSLERIVKEKV